MGRPSKQTVDYFPHDCEGKKTIFTLESLYGNDGYAFWFKLLELLGSTEGHLYNLTKPADKLYLYSRAKVSEELGEKILSTLSDLEAICPKLYAKRLIWCDNFVERLRGVYDKRHTDIPVKPSIRGENPGSRGDNPQSKAKQSKLNYPEWVDVELFEDFLKMRKTIKKPVTSQRAMTGLTNKLKSLTEQGYTQDQIIGEALEKCWQTFYEPKDQIREPENTHVWGQGGTQ